MADVLAKKVVHYFKSCLEPSGFEVHPFLVGWYNKLVATPYKLNYSDDTLACVILSTPSMFEKFFIPFIKAMSDAAFDALPDVPTDFVIDAKLEEARQGCTLIDSRTIDLIHDYDVTPDDVPIVLVQTAGDVAGAVRLYQGCDLDEKHKFKLPFGKIFPCALHPQYIDWYSFRGVYVFCELKDPHLKQPPRQKILESQDEIEDLLKKYNFHGEAWTGGWRDVAPVERYSEKQIEYFKTPPEERKAFLKSFRE